MHDVLSCKRGSSQGFAFQQQSPGVCDLEVIENSNHSPAGKVNLVTKFKSFSNDRQSVIDNALVYACMHGHIAAAKLLLEKGADVNAIPGGFDYSGTALHYAALKGHRDMVEFLIGEGADVHLKDTKVGAAAAGWAEHGGHDDIKVFLQGQIAELTRKEQS